MCAHTHATVRLHVSPNVTQGSRGWVRQRGHELGRNKNNLALLPQGGCWRWLVGGSQWGWGLAVGGRLGGG